MGWLETTISGVPTPWANRIKITVDHTKVDEDLTDFPLLIKLGVGVGITSEDTTAIFDDLSPIEIVFEDDFSAAANWQDLAGSASYLNGYLEHNSDGEQTRNITALNWGTDWDLSFNFKQHGTSSNNDQYFIYLLDAATGGTGYLSLYLRTYSTGDTYLQLTKTGSAIYTNYSYNYAGEAGTWFSVRLKRTSDNLKFKVWRTSDVEPVNWNFNSNVLDGSFSTIGKIRVYTHYTGGAGSGFDNVILSRAPYAAVNKRMALTTSDGVTLCSVEIEDWDEYAKQACLWTKVPYISASEDTVLYLYYDSTMSDNTSYVGDTGTTPAANVWDGEFNAVWHLKNISVAANSSLDSTSAGRSGSPSGMSLSNIVDGKASKALSFDISNDYIDVPSINRGSEFYMSALIRSSDVTTPPRQYIYTQQKNPPSICTYTYQEGQHIHLDGNSLAAQYYYQSSSPYVIALNSSDTSNYILANQWYHVAVAGDSGGARLYINGNLVSSSSTIPAALTVDDGKIGARLDIDSNDYFGGIIDEVRDSYSGRSTAWIKADYNSCFDTLLTYYTPAVTPTFMFEGYTKLSGAPVSRKVGLFRRDNMELVDETTSASGTGYFELYSPYTAYHFMVILPEIADGYNLIGRDQIHPEN